MHLVIASITEIQMRNVGKDLVSGSGVLFGFFVAAMGSSFDVNVWRITLLASITLSVRHLAVQQVVGRRRLPVAVLFLFMNAIYVKDKSSNIPHIAPA
jgi:hypothetical protein